MLPTSTSTVSSSTIKSEEQQQIPQQFDLQQTEELANSSMPKQHSKSVKEAAVVNNLLSPMNQNAENAELDKNALRDQLTALKEKATGLGRVNTYSHFKPAAKNLVDKLEKLCDSLDDAQKTKRMTKEVDVALCALEDLFTDSKKRSDKGFDQKKAQFLDKAQGLRETLNLERANAPATTQKKADIQTFQALKTDIMSLNQEDSETSVGALRDKILALNNKEIQIALLNDNEVRDFIGTIRPKGDALTIAASLLNRCMLWSSGSGPDPSNDFKIKEDGDFSKWMLSGDEMSEFRPDLETGSMNCWEGVLYSMYVAKIVDFDTLNQMHIDAAQAGVQASADVAERLDSDPVFLREAIIKKRFDYMINRPMSEIEQWYDDEIANNQEKIDNYKRAIPTTYGNEAYYRVLVENMGADIAQEWHPGEQPPPAGSLVFFAGEGQERDGEKWKISHVCISSGRNNGEGTEILNFGVSENHRTIWGATTIEEAIEPGGKYASGHVVKFASAPLLD